MLKSDLNGNSCCTFSGGQSSPKLNIFASWEYRPSDVKVFQEREKIWLFKNVNNPDVKMLPPLTSIPFKSQAKYVFASYIALGAVSLLVLKIN